MTADAMLHYVDESGRPRVPTASVLRRPRDPMNHWDLTAWPVVIPLRLMMAQQELARGKASTRR